MRAPAYLLLLLLVFAGAYYFGYAKQSRSTIESPSSDPEGIAHRYPPISQPILHHPFVFILSPGPCKEKTLRSIAEQTYPHYRVITLAEEEGSLHLGSLAQAIQTCQDREIVIPLDGHGWLAHEWVLSRLNQFYADPDLWFTYGQDCLHPSYAMGSSQTISWETCLKGSFRAHPFYVHAPHTFYAALFKQISPSDLSYEEKFLPASIDPAYVFPMLEMAASHFCFIPEVLYISTEKNRDEEELLASCEQYIRSLPAYIPRSTLFSLEER